MIESCSRQCWLPCLPLAQTQQSPQARESPQAECRCLLKQAFGKSGNSACQGMEQSTNSTCYKSLSYKAAALNRQEIMGGLSHNSGNRNGEKREYSDMNLRESTRLITKEIIVMKKRVQSKSQISRLCVRVDDGAINWFRKYNKSPYLLPQTHVKF